MKSAILVVVLIETLFHCVLLEGSAYTRKLGQGLEKDSKYNCDQEISEEFDIIRSPGYPGKYPRYSRCLYTVHRYSKSTCEVKLVMQHFDVEKTIFSNCSADFFEIQNDHKRYRICGELPNRYTKFVFFPDNSDELVFKFQSTFHQKGGFSIEISQLPNSCKKKWQMKEKDTPKYAAMRAPPPCITEINGRTGRIIYPMDDSGSAEDCTFKITKSETQACVVQLDFSSFDVTPSAGCERNYLQLPDGQRLCGTLGGSRKTLQYPPGSDELVLGFISSTENSSAFDIQVTQLPGPCDYELTSNRTGRILRQCDQTIKETSGRITSPGFPGTFGPNYRCTYKIFRPDPSVCQIELEFLTFSLGKHNVPGCHSGAFLELPGKNKLCHDLNGKMMIKVSEFKDPVVFRFQSDSHTSGRGFEIIMNQIPNTCPGYNDHQDIPNSIRRCYQEVTLYSGYFSSSNIRFHFPLGMPMWCEFVVRRADPSVCKLKLQITAKSFLNLPCINNFIHLPNGERMCVSVTERRELWIPENSKHVTMVYYNTNNPEFNLSVEQVSNSCKSENIQNHKSIIRRWVWNITPR